MYASILIPMDVDYLNDSAGVLGRARQLLSEGGKITLTYVVEDVPGLFTEALPDEMVAGVAHAARGKLVEAAEKAGVTADVEIRSGRPQQAIVALAEELDADLVLIRRHRPSARDYLLGSTAADVVRHANSAVLVER